MNPILEILATQIQSLATTYIPIAYAMGKKKAARRGKLKPWSDKDSANVEMLLIRHAQELQGTMVSLEQGVNEGMTLEEAVNNLLSRVSSWAWVLSPTLAAGLSAGVDENRIEFAEDENIPAQDVGVLWYTAEDGKVCKRCDYLAGRWFPAKQAYELAATVHPNCRCPAHFDVGIPSEALVGPIPGYQAGTIDSVFHNLGQIDSRIAKRARLSRAAAAGKPSTYAYPRVNI